MGDFDEFFELESETSNSEDDPTSKTKKTETSDTSTKPQIDERTSGKPSSGANEASQGKPSTKTDDRLVNGFDALFDEAEKASNALKPSISPSPSTPSSGDVDDLFSDFLIDEPKPSQAPPKKVETSAPSKPPTSSPKLVKPVPPPPAPKVTPKESSKNDELEDLFSEVTGVSKESVTDDSKKEDMLQSGLGIEYTQRRKKIPKSAIIAIASFLGIAAIAVFVLPRFFGGGLWGTGGPKKPNDGYEPPSSKVLEELNRRYTSASSLFTKDSVEGYGKAISEFEELLKLDPRHSPTDARLAEAFLLIRENFLDTDGRKRVDNLLAQSENYHPGIIETVRAKARASLGANNLAQAESLANRALTISSKDMDTMVLLGEIAFARSDWNGASKEFSRALELAPGLHRAKYFLALVYLQQGKVEDSERILRELVVGPPPHPRSEIELWHLLYTSYGKVDEAREGLQNLVKNKTALFSNHDLGRSFRYIAEIAEAKTDMIGAIQAMESAMAKDPINHNNGFYLGRLYINQQEYAKASEQFSRASSLSTENPDYLIFLGHAQRENGKAEEALTSLKKGLEKAPGSIEGLYQLALTQKKLSQTDEAINSLETVLKNDPNHLDSMIILGELYAQKDNFRVAETQLRAALAQAPKSVRALNSMGEVLLTTRRWSQALEKFRLAEEQDSQNVTVLANIGRTYLELRKIEEAANYFQKALSLDATRTETQVAFGQLQHQQKEYAKALETYRKVLEARPKDYDTRVKLAQVLIDQQSFQEAVSELQEASKYKPDYYPTRLNLGVAWRGVGDLEASLEAIAQALVIRPEASEAHYQLELTYIFKNDIPSAEKALENAVKYEPKFVAPLVALGDLHSSRNYNTDASKYYERALKIEPKSADILLKVGEAYRREGSAKQAMSYYEKAIAVGKLGKKASQAYLGLGLIAEDSQKQEAAMKYYKKAQLTDPEFPSPYYYLGLIYKERNQAKAAIAAFKKYLQLDPQSKEKEDIEDQIRRLKQN